MAYKRFVLVIAFAAALLLVGGLFTILSAQAGEVFGSNHSPAANLNNDLPDLTITRVDLLTVTATSLDYRFVIKNIGVITADLDGTLPDSTDDVLIQTILSEDTTYGNSGDKATGGFSIVPYITELGPGKELTLTQIANPSDIYFFDYNYFMVMIDSSDCLTETLENNNVGYASLPNGPDLIVEDIDVLSISDSGVVYRFVVRNIGDGIADLNGPDEMDPMDNINFQGYLSPNNILGDAGDIAAGGGYILSPTELYPDDVFTQTILAGMLGSNFLDYRFIFVDIDLVNNLPETNENNNRGMAEVPYFTYLPLVQR